MLCGTTCSVTEPFVCSFARGVHRQLVDVCYPDLSHVRHSEALEVSHNNNFTHATSLSFCALTILDDIRQHGVPALVKSFQNRLVVVAITKLPLQRLSPPFSKVGANALVSLLIGYSSLPLVSFSCISWLIDILKPQVQIRALPTPP